ncbi:hypothetical protein STCU_05027 [Strigomonas culicis]|uniref:Transmembrane protein n=1 Tax=Strigomonas culicis TaxID=28005 RepID=S9UI08_9TRYP|nr:hypothetical protein STCU_05027 [Strigomonas culicis]|eukprot:EPY28553.1 hypothetical protein STCU_05027 [Strigomonas culicis]
MLRVTSRVHFFDKLGSTKLGAEVLAKTRSDMQNIAQPEKTNMLLRFFTRRRPIDFLAIEVDGPMTKELLPHFRYVRHGLTCLLMAPVFYYLFTGRMAPSYYIMVSTRLFTREQYDRMWELSDWYMVLAGQCFVAVVLYDFSVYLRYPFFAYVVAPFYRKMNWSKPLPTGSYSVKELRGGVARRAAPAPLGRPLGQVKRQAAKDKPNPFGTHKK